MHQAGLGVDSPQTRIVKGMFLQVEKGSNLRSLFPRISKDFVLLSKMSKSNTKEEKVALFKRLNEFLDTNDQAICEEVFAQDHRMIIPSTGGKESKEFPVPPGIEGIALNNLRPDSLRPEDVRKFTAQRILRY